MMPVHDYSWNLGITGVAIVILALRIITKLRINKFGADDLLMVFVLVG